MKSQGVEKVIITTDDTSAYKSIEKSRWDKDIEIMHRDEIVEAQKKKINTIGDLNNVVEKTLRSSQKTLLIAIYNNQNQRRYIGVKLN